MKLATFYTFCGIFLLFLQTISALPLSTRSLKSCYKKATLTQYWIPKEGDKDMLNDGKIVTLSGLKSKTLKTKNGKTIAKVSKTTYEVNLYINIWKRKRNLTFIIL
jgi:hypothetical protein